MSTEAERRPWHWLAWLIAFLVVELPAAIKHTGGTLSETIPRWFPSRLRFLLLLQFLVVLGAHLYGIVVATLGEPRAWWSAWWMITGSGVLPAGSIVYAELWERRVSVGSIKTWFIRKLVRGPLEKLQASLKGEGGMKMSPAVKTVLWFVGLVIAQAAWDYFAADKTPTFAEGGRYVVGAVIAAALFWAKSGRLPNMSEVREGLATQGNIAIANDNPRDPVRVIVSGKEVEPKIVLESLIEPAPEK